MRNTTESASAAAGGEEGTGFIFGEGQAWSEASWPGAGPVLSAKCLGILTTDQGHRAIKRDPSFPSSAMKNSMASHFFLTSLIN